MGAKLLFLQLQVSAAVLLILLLRQGMKRLPKIYSYLLWILVFGRLLCPVMLESRIGLMPSPEEINHWAERIVSGEEGAFKGEGAGQWADGFTEAGNIGQQIIKDSVDTLGMAEGALMKNPTVPGQDMAVIGVGSEKDMGDRKDDTVWTFVSGFEALKAGLTGILKDRRAVFMGLAFLLWAMGAAVVLGYDMTALSRMRRRLHGAVQWGEAEDIGSEATEKPFSQLGFYRKRGEFGGRRGSFCEGKRDIRGRQGSFCGRQGDFRGRRNLYGRQKRLVQRGIYFCEGINVPFTMGVFQPRIYLPKGIEGEELEYILCHEGVHIRRRDYLVKSAAFLLTAINWFNPFVWVAFHFMESDMEMSCDEKVVEIMGANIKRQYSQSLLNFAVEKGQMAMTPLTFGENNVKGRIKNVLSYKNIGRNARKWSVVLGIVVLAGMWAVLFTARVEGAQVQGGSGEDGWNGNSSPGSQLLGSGTDGSSPEGTHPEGSGTDGNGSKGSDPEGTRPEASGTDGNGPDGSGPEGTHPEGSGINEGGSDGSGGNVNGSDGSQGGKGKAGEAGEADSGAKSQAQVYWSGRMGNQGQGRTTEGYAVEIRSDGIYKLEEEEWSCLYSGYISPDVKWCDENGILYFTWGSDYEKNGGEYLVDKICMLDLDTGVLDRETLAVDKGKVRDEDIILLDIAQGFVIMYRRGTDVVIPLVNTGESPLAMGHRWNNKAVAELNQEERDAYGAAVREELLKTPGLLLELGNRSLEETFTYLDLDGDGRAEEIVLSADPEKEPVHLAYDACRFQAGDSWLSGRMENVSNCIWAFSPDGSRIILALYSDGGQTARTILFSYEDGELREVGNLPQDIRDCTIADGCIEGTAVLYDAMMPFYMWVSYRFNQEGVLEPVQQDSYELMEIGDAELMISLPVHESPEGEEVRFMEPQTVRFGRIDSSYQWIYLEGEDGDGGWFKVGGKMRSWIEELSMDSSEVFELNYAG